MSGMAAVVRGALAIAAVSTAGDFIWATWIPRALPVYGVVHGLALFLAIGLFLGVSARRPAAGAAGGALLGAGGAVGFYLLFPIAGYAAMFLMWVAIWIGLGMLWKWLVREAKDLRADMVRGVMAAIGSGLAFYAISGIWRPFNPRGWDYATHFAAWTLAYVPGFAALLLARTKPGAGT